MRSGPSASRLSCYSIRMTHQHACCLMTHQCSHMDQCQVAGHLSGLCGGGHSSYTRCWITLHLQVRDSSPTQSAHSAPSLLHADCHRGTQSTLTCTRQLPTASSSWQQLLFPSQHMGHRRRHQLMPPQHLGSQQLQLGCRLALLTCHTPRAQLIVASTLGGWPARMETINGGQHQL